MKFYNIPHIRTRLWFKNTLQKKQHLKHETTLIMVLNNQDHGIYKEINSHSCFQGESASNLH